MFRRIMYNRTIETVPVLLKYFISKLIYYAI